MSCLIYASNSEGCTGRCDANCYNATGAVCDCICGGMNHGVGLKQATDNTAKYCDEWIKKYAQEKNVDPKTIRVNGEVFQLSLF